MGAKRWTTLRLLVNCTLRGGLYGLIGGTVTGLFFAICGAFYGAPIGCILGLGFGLLNGLAIRVLTPCGPDFGPSHLYRQSVTICCLGTSAIVNAVLVILDLSCFHTIVLAYCCLLGIPAILISARRLANFVSNWYPGQFMEVDSAANGENEFCSKA